MVDENKINGFLLDIEHEYTKARKKHPPMHSAHEGISVIREEFEELWDHVKADTAHTDAAYTEAVHLATMAMAFALEINGKLMDYQKTE